MFIALKRFKPTRIASHLLSCSLWAWRTELFDRRLLSCCGSSETHAKKIENGTDRKSEFSAFQRYVWHLWSTKTKRETPLSKWDSWNFQWPSGQWFRATSSPLIGWIGVLLFHKVNPHSILTWTNFQCQSFSLYLSIPTWSEEKRTDRDLFWRLW